MKLIFDYIRCIWYNKYLLLAYFILLLSFLVRDDYGFLLFILSMYLFLVTMFGAETLQSYYISMNLIKKSKKSFIPKYTLYCNVVGLKMAERELEGKYF